MAPGPTDPGGVTGTPEEIRAQMTETRETLSRELGALRGRLFGTRNPARNERGTTVAKTKKKATGAAGKTKAAAKGGAAKKKAGGAKKSAAKGAAKKGGAKKTGAKKAGTAKSSASRTTKPASKKRVTKKKPTTRTVIDQAKEVLGEVATGAAAGALKGDAEAVSGEAQTVAEKAEQAQPSAGGGQSGGM